MTVRRSRLAPLGRLLAGSAATAALLLTASSGAVADDGPDTGAAIVHLERTDTGIEVSVDVPADATPDLAGVTATINDISYDATAARIADGDSLVRRTAVLAIDTSDSMDGTRFEAAKAAALTFLSTVPADVEVGIITFDATVQSPLAPTTDRGAARDVVAALTLHRGTLLNDAVLAAVAAADAGGQGNVLVLSDGADTSTTPDSTVAAAVADSDVVVDVVGLEQSKKSLKKLRRLTGDNGQVISSDSAALSAAFTAQAEVLARQVAVTIEAPADLVAQQVSVAVTLPTAGGDLVATSTFPAAVEAVDATLPVAVAPTRGTGFDAPGWFMYAGVGVFGVGLIAALVMMVPAKPVAMTPEERVSTYTSGLSGVRKKPKEESEPALTQATAAVADLLKRNQSLDARIVKRLAAAGSELKSSEWLLLHAALFVGTTVVGLLLGRGNIVIGLMFMALGAVGPWVYLGFRKTRRRKAFDAMLPETLQLMSGSLSAGLSLMQSVDTIVREGGEPVASEFRRVLVETRIGVSLEEALEGVADRFDSRDFRWVVMAIRIQRQVGGNLAELLNTVGETMREREYIRRQVGALAAEGKISAVVLGGLPPVFLLYLILAQRSYVEPLFTDVRGIIMLVGGALWLGVGVFWMSRLVKVEV
ncbi:hypothetical protein BH11ACT8_BH11ACT8_06590 [soil metagenome]